MRFKIKLLLLVCIVGLLLHTDNIWGSDTEPGSMNGGLLETPQEREDREWRENFKEKFEEDPREGFNRDRDKAWETLNEDPQLLITSSEMIDEAFDNSWIRFIELVFDDVELIKDERVRDKIIKLLELFGRLELLEELVVRDGYERHIEENPSHANDHPEVFNEYLEQEGIEPPSSNDFEVVEFDHSEREMEARTEDERLVRYHVDDVRNVFPDGSVRLDNGIRVNSGEISSRTIDGVKEYTITKLEDDVEVEVVIRGEIFRGDDMIIGRDSQNEQFVEVLNSPIETDSGDKVLSSGRYTLLQNGNYGLNGDIRYFDQNGNSIQAYSTEQDTTIATPSVGCGESGNCIIESENDLGEPTLDVWVSNDHYLGIEINNLDERTIEVNEISDPSSVEIESLTENERVVFISTKERIIQTGFMSEDNKLTVISTHTDPNNPSLGSIQHINGLTLRNNFEPDSLPQIINDYVDSLQNSQEIDVSGFLQFYDVEPTDAHILELYNQFQREELIDENDNEQITPQQAIEQMHEVMQRITQEEESVSEIRASEIIIKDLEEEIRLLLGYIENEINSPIPSPVPTVQGEWGANNCQVSNLRHCRIGEVNFRVKVINDDQKVYVTASGDMFDERGARVNQEGQYIQFNSELCPDSSPCSYNSQANYFKGGIRQAQAVGHIGHD